MTAKLQAQMDQDCDYGTVPGAIFNELHREWQIQKRRADDLEAAIQKSDRKNYLPQLVALQERNLSSQRNLGEMTEKRDRLALALPQAVQALTSLAAHIASMDGADAKPLIDAIAGMKERFAEVLKENT